MDATENDTNQKPSAAPIHLEAMERIGSIPIVETGIRTVEGVYGQIKGNNRLFNWYLGTAEATLFAAFATVKPAIRLFETPLKRLDTIVCTGLDVIERRAPVVYMPPETMYWNTKEYMSDRLVKPVIQRADSVKQFGNAVLEYPLTAYAADRIDGAFTVADKYVDKYLTIEGESDQADAKAYECEAEAAANERPAFKAIHHGQRFSRKLKRSITQRTLIEARALKKQSKEAINVLIYAAELMVKDPKEAYAKASEIWAYLSADEPENQARPKTLEQLIVLLTRESARRVVHLVNYTKTATSIIPKTIVSSGTQLLHEMRHLVDTLPKPSDVKNKTRQESQNALKRAQILYEFIQNFATTSLENFALILAGRGIATTTSNSKPSSSCKNSSNSGRRSQPNRSNNSAEPHNANGVY